MASDEKWFFFFFFFILRTKHRHFAMKLECVYIYCWIKTYLVMIQSMRTTQTMNSRHRCAFWLPLEWLQSEWLSEELNSLLAG